MNLTLHSTIIKNTATDGFVAAIQAEVFPYIEEKLGEVSDVQMYEDYISDSLVKDGEQYYPLTVVSGGAPTHQWIKWSVTNKDSFGATPFAYVGEEPLEITPVEDVPAGFEEKISGRDIYYEYEGAPLRIDAVSTDAAFLAGKYSQTFVDELTRKISKEIERTFSVSPLKDSGIELHLVFAPGTYMEHNVANVTFRRLLITARGCAARDLWIKWTNTEGEEPLSVSSSVSRGAVLFEIAEDVPHKIREKEYRFLARTSPEKYQYAMGRKNVTEWREIIKRAIKRGELVKLEMPVFEPTSEVAATEIEHFADMENDLALQEKLRDVLGITPTEEVADTDADGQKQDDGELARLLMNALGYTEPKVAEEPTAEADEELCEREETEEAEEEEIEAEAEAEEEAEEIEDEFSSITEADEEEDAESLADYEQLEGITEGDVYAEEEGLVAEENRPLDEDELRRKIEEEIRARLELEARQRAEEEMERLRLANDALKAENERLATIARQTEADKLESDAEHEEEKEELRRQLEAMELAEQRERERIVEAARLAQIEEQRRIAMKEEEERLALEREERERAERERLEAEERAREAQRQAEEARKQKEEEERRRAEEAAKPTYTYVSKNARLIFNKPVDPNIIKRIHEIMLTTIKYFHKEDVYIKIKASVPDTTTVNLFFEKFPEEENELLINIIKVLGKSGLGIVKVYLE